MEKKFRDFLKEFNSQSVEVVDLTNKDMCFDLAVAWCMWLGLPQNIFSGLLNAYQIWTNPNSLMKERFNFIENTTDAKPQVGDIVVFDKVRNHVVVATGEAVVENKPNDWFNAFSQNDPIGSVCVVKTYKFNHVLGWLRYKGMTDELAECLKAHKQAVDSANKKDEEIKTLNIKLFDLSKRNAELNDGVSRLNEQVINEKKKYDLLQNEMVTKLAKKDLDWEKKLADQETRMLSDFSLKEEEWKKEKEELEKKAKEKEIVIEKEPIKPKTIKDKIMATVNIWF